MCIRSDFASSPLLVALIGLFVGHRWRIIALKRVSPACLHVGQQQKKKSSIRWIESLFDRMLHMHHIRALFALRCHCSYACWCMRTYPLDHPIYLFLFIFRNWWPLHRSKRCASSELNWFAAIQNLITPFFRLQRVACRVAFMCNRLRKWCRQECRSKGLFIEY